MLAGGSLPQKGVGKLFFVTGTMNSFSYNQTLEFYKDDTEKFDKNLIIQQDNGLCHAGKKSIDFIKNNFSNCLKFCPLIILIYLLLRNYGQLLKKNLINIYSKIHQIWLKTSIGIEQNPKNHL